MKAFALPLALSVSLAGCAKINDASMWVLSSSAPAVAVVSETVLSGKVVMKTNRAGTVTLQAASGLQCMGDLRYTASTSGSIQLQCSDGNEAALSFKALSETSGHASGQARRGPATLAYGLPPAEAAAYLTVPPGKRLVNTPAGLRLD